MSVIAFDTLKFVKRLKVAGMSEEQAEALSEAFAEAQRNQLENLVTKTDIKELEMKINVQLHNFIPKFTQFEIINTTKYFLFKINQTNLNFS